MSRKSGKPPQQPLSERDRRELLDELGSVQDMLQDTGAGADDDAAAEPPVLEPEDGGEAGGDADQQMPLLQPEDPTEPGRDQANERLRQALRERPNPFLSGAARQTGPNEQRAAVPETASASPSTDAPAAAPGEGASAPAGAGESGDASTLTEEQMRALVDEVLAAWLPKIERELRDRLMERLRHNHPG